MPAQAQQQQPDQAQVNMPQLPPTKVVRYSQTSFAGGEYSPICDARTDLDRYKIGLETCRNAIIHPTGGVSNRAGFRMIAPTKTQNLPSRMVKFIFNTSEVFFLEFGNYYIRFYTARSQVQATNVAAYSSGTLYLPGAFVTYNSITYYCIQSGTNQEPDISPTFWVAQTAYEIPTPYAQVDINNLRFEESADFIYITHNNYPQMILERISNANWSLVSYLNQVIDGPFLAENTDTSLNLTTNAPNGTGVLLTASANAWAADTQYNVGDYVQQSGNEYQCLVPHVSAATLLSSALSALAAANNNANGGTIAWNASTYQASYNVGGLPPPGAANTEYLAFTNFGFNLPSTATILGVIVTVNNQGTYYNAQTQRGQPPDIFPQVTDSSIKLIKAGTPGGTDHSAGAAWGQSYFPGFGATPIPQTVTYGNSGDLWGETLAYSDVNNTGFGVAIAANMLNGGGAPNSPAVAQINSVTIQIYYSTGTFASDLAAGYWQEVAVNIFNVGHIGALWRKTDYIQAQSVVLSASGAAISGSISCFTSWLLISNGTWTGNFQLEMSEDGGATWTVLQYFTGDSNFNVDTSNTENVTNHLVPFLLRINVTALSAGSIEVTLSSLAYYNDGFLRITGYNSPTQVVCDVLQNTTTTASFTWAEGAWSTYRGYPSRSRFYQDRLGFFGSPNNPTTNWFTVDGDYISFLVSNPSEDSDGITEDLNAREQNIINGVVAFQALLVLTSQASWAIQPISGSALTPETVDIGVEDYNGSDGPEPVVIGNEAIFAQFQGHVIRSIVYEFAYSAFTSKEINIMARHLLEDWTVIDMCYQQNPDNIIWFLRSDGQLLGLTYLKEQDVVAWHHHDTNGTFESIAAAPGIGYTEVWATVNRPNGRFVEVMEDRLTEDVRQAFFVDNGVSNTPTIFKVGAVSQTNPIQVTVPQHALVTGNIVEFDSVVGLTQQGAQPTLSILNGQQYKITWVDVNNFTIQDAASGQPINGIGLTPYVSGGNCIQCFTTFALPRSYNGQLCSILGDGFVFPKQVISGSQVTLPRPCAWINVGFQYISDVETLPVELSFWFNPPPPMTTQGRPVKIGGVTFSFVDSRGGWVGTSEYDSYGNVKLKESFFPIQTTPNGVQQLLTGDFRVALGGGWETGARVFFRQYDPLPFTIVRIIPEVIVGGVTCLAQKSTNPSASGVGTITNQ